MLLLTFLVLLLSDFCAAKSVSEAYDKRPQCRCARGGREARVVGGRDAGRGRFPFASCLWRADSSGPFCGATLVTDSHVVTAAHCVKDFAPGDLLVDVGDYDLRSADRGSHLRRALRVSRHPGYSPGALYSDIAVVEFERPLAEGHGAAVLPPAGGLPLPPGTPVAVFGWGRLEYDGGAHSPVLQSVVLPVVGRAECQDSFRTRIRPDMLCAGGQPGRDACIGDSGSGLVSLSGVLCGVVSFGRRCGVRGVPGVYARVSAHTPWILGRTAGAGCRPCVLDAKAPRKRNDNDTRNSFVI